MSYIEKYQESSSIFPEDSQLNDIFELLTNHTKSDMIKMKNNFESKDDYVRHILPLFINENFSEVESESNNFKSTYGGIDSTIPLSYVLRVDLEESKEGKYLALTGYEIGCHKSEYNRSWKERNFIEYVEFKDSDQFIVQLLVQQTSTYQGRFRDTQDLNGIIVSRDKMIQKKSQSKEKFQQIQQTEEDRTTQQQQTSTNEGEFHDFQDLNRIIKSTDKMKQKKSQSKEKIKQKKKERTTNQYKEGQIIYLPWNDEVLNTFKIPNIYIENDTYTSIQAHSIHQKMINEYQKLKNPTLEESIYPHTFIVHLNPIMRPSRYIIEKQALLQANNTPFFSAVIKPSKENNIDITKETEIFGQGLRDTFSQFFSNTAIRNSYNPSQESAIEDACDYRNPITIIEGPPGTGKTLTSLGIMSVVLEHMEKIGENGIIVACSQSNSVINDWMRKIVLGRDQTLMQLVDGVPINTIINSRGDPHQVKALRIGVSDKCDPGLYDYALDIIAQRIYFEKVLEESDKSDLNALFPNEGTQCYSMTHVKKLIREIKSQKSSVWDQIESLEIVIEEIKQLVFESSDYIMTLEQDEDINRLEQEEDIKTLKQDCKQKQTEIEELKSSIELKDAQKKILRKLFVTMKDLVEKNSKRKRYQEILSETINNVNEIFQVKAKIIVTTPCSSFSTVLKKYTQKDNLIIQLLVIDEAPQCNEASILIPLIVYEVRKLVLIGDRRQLGPMIHDKKNSYKLKYSRSLYERLIKKMTYFLLNTQYRSLPNLSEITSELFYNRLVNNAGSLWNKPLPGYLIDLLKRERNFLFFDLIQSQQERSKSYSYYNDAEARAVVQLASYLIQYQTYQNVRPQLSIISPYRAQVELIKDYLDEMYGSKTIYLLIEVCTVDSFQGKENDIMIISLVRSEGVGFLSDPKRINVATSRAQYAQYIFGNKFALSKIMKIIYNILRDQNAIVEYTQQDANELDFNQILNY